MYQIKNYSYQRAKELGYTILPSTKKDKKIDVYKNNDYLFSIGNLNFGDFPTFIELYGLEYALERRRLYHLRHSKDNIKGTKGWWAAMLLW